MTSKHLNLVLSHGGSLVKIVKYEPKGIRHTDQFTLKILGNANRYGMKGELYKITPNTVRNLIKAREKCEAQDVVADQV